MMDPTRVLVWQWGRYGAGPRIAAVMTDALRSLPGVTVSLSLPRQAEILRGTAPPVCDLPVDTYRGMAGFIARLLTSPFAIPALTRRLRTFAPDFAICAMPGPLDFMMAAAARRAGARVVILVHDADSHPGDGFPLQMWLQRRLCHAADAIAYLSAHVGERLKAQKITSVPLIQLSHPPMSFGVPPLQPHNGPLRLLHFGRLLPYKGLDLLAGALASLGPRPDLTVRVVGSGPAGPELDALNHMPNVTVENRWVPEEEVRDVLTWADALVLPYREASQSGVAAAALAAGRAVVSTNVGGLAEQLGGSDRALLCEPTTEGLANGLRTLLENPPAATGTFEDPATAWRDMAASLLRQARALPAPG